MLLIVLVLVLSPPRRTEYEYDEIRCDARTRFDVDQIIVPELGSYNSDGRAR